MDPFRILIVDDDAHLRQTLAAVLAAKGYEPFTAGSGAEGFALLAERPVDLVLLDLGLPDIPGLEVLARVKDGPAAVQVIILTGNATLASAVEAANRGAFSFLLKPYDIDQLLLQVRRAIEKQQAEEEIRRHNRELQRMNTELKALYEISQAISRSLDMDQLLPQALHALVESELFPFEVCGAIFLVEENRVRLASFVSRTDLVVEPCREVHPGECPCGQALAAEEVVVADRVSGKGLCHPVSSPHGRIVLPLKAFDGVVGLLSLFTRPGTEVNDSQLRLLTILSNQIGIAIHNARLYEESKSFSLHDPLTGLANRRFLEIQLEKNFSLARRYGERFALIMLDVDHFKRYNDTYGHPQGDRLLVQLAELLRREVRRSDYVFRYGGEEFLVILPETSLATATEVAERLRAAVEAEAAVTISLGVATLQEDTPDKESLIDRVDAALYSAKRRGRNRLERAEGEETLPMHQANL